MEHNDYRIFAVNYLKEIEFKHENYFKHLEIDIMDCVIIVENPFVSISIIRRDLPKTIVNDIKKMFWL